MIAPDLDHTIARWVRLGVLFGARPAHGSPDVERLLLATARLAPGHARLFYLSVSWLGRYGGYVARHRLRHLIGEELAPEDQPVLGALLALAVAHGASRELLPVARACATSDPVRPAFDVHRDDSALRDVAEKHACPEALPWGLWVPNQPVRDDALRPAHWILEHNPRLHDRIVRRGDLRSTILVTLRRDVPGGRIRSEAALSRLCSANRLAVRKALDDLELEGRAQRRRAPGRRGTLIELAEPGAASH